MSIIFWTLEKGTSLWAAPMSQGQKPTFVAGTASAAQFSHDGKWLAYGSTETGGSEVYIRPAESPEPRRPVSPNGGILPRWRTDGKETELFYVSTIDRKLISVKIRVAGSSVRFESPTVLFDMGTAASTGHSGGPFHFYAVSPDGQQFLVPRAVSPDGFRPSPITVIRDWNPSRDP
jgi:hypothetical protein